MKALKLLFFCPDKQQSAFDVGLKQQVLICHVTIIGSSEGLDDTELGAVGIKVKLMVMRRLLYARMLLEERQWAKYVALVHTLKNFGGLSY